MRKTYIPKGTKISKDAALAYEENKKNMVEKIDYIMIELNNNENLIGDNPISVMQVNHANHADFMTNLFKLNDFNMLNDTLFWVIGSYESRGFKKSYFPKVLDAWVDVINSTLKKDHAKEIIIVYEFIKSSLKDIEKETAKKSKGDDYPFSKDWALNKNKFTEILLEGNTLKAMDFSTALVNDITSLKEFHIKVVTYALYEVGRLWEKGHISIAQEHLATAIVMRIMSLLYMNLATLEHNKGKVIVTSAANEQHEVGARIVADILEVNGWDVIYLGANTPIYDVVKTALEAKPCFIALSVTMTFNIDSAISLIKEIKKEDALEQTKIIAGGHVFKYGDLDKAKLGADVIESDIDKMLKIVEKWAK